MSEVTTIHSGISKGPFSSWLKTIQQSDPQFNGDSSTAHREAVSGRLGRAPWKPSAAALGTSGLITAAHSNLNEESRVSHEPTLASRDVAWVILQPTNDSSRW